FKTDEERYLIAVGEAFLESGTLINGWESRLVSRLRSEIFVSAPKAAAADEIPVVPTDRASDPLRLAQIVEVQSAAIPTPMLLREQSKFLSEAIQTPLSGNSMPSLSVGQG